ncbi:hypothetical protein 44RRORF012c [Aeromonas phage 44RR2.8t]|uniref:Uncharacterized protein n=2 Tax=Biquartavirus 44RR2 TaxID=115987 RepID=Q6U9U0_9CAUD|nr:hypothetical protein ST44RRORF012c [Aeromonas phage 44RR2.8t]AAQ81331.1 hypothetical protein 44RRORF012c [Aeromonas phage 44RR2.8t]APU00484.1 hypothetical protein [Aeromonas phage 44RR2.8t.2]
MKIQMKLNVLPEYHAEYCKTQGQRLWASILEGKSKEGDLRVIEVMEDGGWKTNAEFLGYAIGIPVNEQKFFEEQFEVNV